MAHFRLAGSQRSAVVGARSTGPTDPTERFEVTMVLRRRSLHEFTQRAVVLGSATSAPTTLSREDYAARHGADAGDIKAVIAFASSYQLQVVQQDAARCVVVLSGTAEQFCKAFNVELHHMVLAGGSYRGREGDVHLPQELDGIVLAVLGLDNRSQANPHFRVRPRLGNIGWRPARAAATSFLPTKLASLYDFPEGTGQGECVAIIELGGGFRPDDLDAYFQELGLATPTVQAVSVDHATNAPTGDGNGPDGEVMLDIEVVGAIAPQASIAVYFAPNTDAGFLNAITTAIHDPLRKPSVISISWGGPESSWTAQAMTAMDSAFQTAAALGVSVCVACGDNGSSDGVTDGADHVDFPASSPFALACGGTSVTAGSKGLEAEKVWNNGVGNGATGGGVSSFFPLAAWQQGLQTVNAKGQKTALGKRGVPDVAADADPETGYRVRVDGADTVIGGTSAVAPLWAGLIALLNQAAGKPAGYLNPLLYRHAAAFNDITVGNNGDFSAATGWDACTGLGSPDGVKLQTALRGDAT